MFCTPLAQKPEVKLRFSCGDSVGFRVGDHDDGSDQWFNGVVRETWAKLSGPCTFEEIQFAQFVTYRLEVDPSHAFEESVFYCHRDDHTLIRKPQNIPQIRTRGISKRMEKRRLVDGAWEMFDHVTLRGRRLIKDAKESG